MPLPNDVTFLHSDPADRLALSPDGTRLALAGTGTDGQDRLYVRSLNALTWQPLAGTEGATAPFWSPDSKHLGFVAAGKLKRIELASAGVLILCLLALALGTWHKLSLASQKRALLAKAQAGQEAWEANNSLAAELAGGQPPPARATSLFVGPTNTSVLGEVTSEGDLLVVVALNVAQRIQHLGAQFGVLFNIKQPAQRGQLFGAHQLSLRLLQALELVHAHGQRAVARAQARAVGAAETVRLVGKAHLLHQGEAGVRHHH